MKSKYFLLAAALFVACSDDSSSTAVNNSAEYTYTDCLQTVFDFEKSILSAYDKDYHGLVTDSLYMDKGSASSRGKRYEDEEYGKYFGKHDLNISV